MAHIPTDQELDQLRSWLKAKLPAITPKEPPPPSPELLELAWQAAKAHQAYAINQGLPLTQFILPKAAADGSSANAPREYTQKIEFMEGDKAVVGEYVVSPEDLPMDAENQLLRFKCSQEFLPKCQGRAVQVIVDGQTFDLGVIDRRGSAKAKIPRGLDWDAGFHVNFGEWKKG